MTKTLPMSIQLEVVRLISSPIGEEMHTNNQARTANGVVNLNNQALALIASGKIPKSRAEFVCKVYCIRYFFGRCSTLSVADFNLAMQISKSWNKQYIADYPSNWKELAVSINTIHGKTHESKVVLFTEILHKTSRRAW